MVLQYPSCSWREKREFLTVARFTATCPRDARDKPAVAAPPVERKRQFIFCLHFANVLEVHVKTTTHWHEANMPPCKSASSTGCDVGVSRLVAKGLLTCETCGHLGEQVNPVRFCN